MKGNNWLHEEKKQEVFNQETPEMLYTPMSFEKKANDENKRWQVSG